MGLKMNKNILIFGGGLTGMLTALWAKKTFPKENISLLESSKIGIVGVGEGTVPNIVPFLESIEIDVLEFISKTRGTLKLGIAFENWNGDGKKYYHGFDMNCPIENVYKHALFYDLYSNQNVDENKIIISNNLQENNRVCFSIENNQVNSFGTFALHFDAFLVIDYLRSKCEERGIYLYEDKCTHVTESEKGIDKIHLESGKEISVDFVFDCSGFARKLIGEVFGSKWISYEKHIPHNKAIAGPLHYKENESVFPYTRAVAMPNGWIWQIPTMDRIGCGYVFDETFVSVDEAKFQRDNFVGYETDIARVVDFRAGRFEKSWIKNCVALGLSAHFIEPLEATSIWTTCSFLNRLGDFSPYFFGDENKLEKIRKEYNENFVASNENTVAFIYYHYLTKRNDSEFWRTFRDRTEVPEKLIEILEYIKHVPIDNAILERYNASCITNFNLNSWIQVGSTTYLDLTIMREYSEYYGISKVVNPTYDEATRISDEVVKKSLTHNEFLKILGR